MRKLPLKGCEVGNFPSVAILLAAFNGAHFIREQVESILKQKNVNIYLYISIDQSTDDTYQICEELAAESKNISLLDYGSVFGGAAKNFYRLIRDVRLNNFDYIALADQDDIWFEDKLHRAIIVMREHTVSAYSSGVVAFWPDGKARNIKKSYPPTLYDYYFESAGPGCTYVFKAKQLVYFKHFLKDNWNEVNQVELHDWMLYAYFRCCLGGWIIDDQLTMMYRQHTANQFGSNSGFKAMLKRVQMLRNKWYASEVNKIYKLLPTKEAGFSLQRFFLLKNFWKLRRKPIDKLAILFVLLAGLLP